MQITLTLPESLTQTDTFNQSDWLREIAIALCQQTNVVDKILIFFTGNNYALQRLQNN